MAKLSEFAVVRLPKISNFTDFDALAREEDVSLRYVKSAQELGNPDLVILPGSKNTTEDLLFLKESGLEKSIIKLNKQGTPIIGICGGYQMLGQEVRDPEHTESNLDSLAGLNLLPLITIFEAEKITRQVQVRAQDNQFLGMNYTGESMTGYEIHAGRTYYTQEVRKAFVVDRSDQSGVLDGAISENGLVMGTYVHGIFDNDGLRRCLLNSLRQAKGLEELANQQDSASLKEQAYEKLANSVRANLDMAKIYQVMGLK